ncbi:GNAT family N-acetyltransferase [Pseudoalteromonas sp. MMG013]|uniref:GNAT family N-acetyltransferase n=1 Tax=Pseudoalteromonas sp. MMG013 TaxID=2822687 RepID=UPI001B38D19F|nr:GNAT family N-acetyltransferase [Pseudoalteromonas sp. MMG013]MBQ4863575.1 GNAT family N-acetyltransferase [Pseudoalteromonas sp. MMG013]
MELVIPTEKQLRTLMLWFEDKQAVREWAGPSFPFPFNFESFKENLNLNKVSSYVLVDNKEECFAFGQVYERLGRCHLGRLSVSPQHRGEGIANHLISLLIKQGRTLFHLEEVSLFVLMHNLSAIRAYEKAGFRFATYPGTIPYNECLYMTLSCR